MISFVPLPYGVRNIKLYPLNSADVPSATSVNLPNARTMQFAEAEAFTDLRGDDSLIAVHGNGPEVNWTIDAGGCTLEAVKTVYGGTIVETGTTPNGVKTLTKLKTDLRPYFQAIGQAISDSGGDFHIVIYKCKATGDLGMNLQEGQFTITNMKGKALANASLNLWGFTQNESVVALV